jgi:hypothetical protein
MKLLGGELPQSAIVLCICGILVVAELAFGNQMFRSLLRRDCDPHQTSSTETKTIKEIATDVKLSCIFCQLTLHFFTIKTPFHYRKPFLSACVADYHSALHLYRPVVAHIVRHFSTLALVGVFTFLKCIATKVLASLEVAPSYCRRQMLTISKLIFVPHGLPLIRYQRKKSCNPAPVNFMWTSTCATPNMKTNCVTNESSVFTTVTFSYCNCPKSSSIFNLLIRVVRQSYIGCSAILRVSSLIHAIILFLAMSVLTFPVNAKFCHYMSLDLARSQLAAAALPSGLVFFAGGQSSGAYLGAFVIALQK